jgi:hypothetical protein
MIFEILAFGSLALAALVVVPRALPADWSSLDLKVRIFRVVDTRLRVERDDE